jgi:DNA-binding CsgD family transcriptional regulator
MLVLKGRAAPGVSPAPYLVLAQALIPVLRRNGVKDDAELKTALLIIERILHEPSGQRALEASGPVIYEAVVRVLIATARGTGGVLLILEDAQWADPDSLGAVDYFGDKLSAAPVLCIVTVRDDPSLGLDVVEAMATRRAAHRFELKRLSQDEVTELARCSLDTNEISSELVDTLRTRAEGVPFVAEEMLTAYVSSGGVQTSPAALPRTYRELVHTRLRLLDDPARQILFAAAVVGRRFDWSLLGSITGYDETQVLAALRRSVRENLTIIDPAATLDVQFGFRHALVREAILAEMLPPERQELAGRAADVIEDRYTGLPGDWCERVADLRETAGDGAAAARHLQESARRALAHGALASAESMLERARVLVSEDRWHRIGIDRQLVEVLASAGKLDRLREIAVEAVEWVRGKHREIPFVVLGLGDLHLRLARGLASAGDSVGVDEHLSRAHEVGVETADEQLLARVRVVEASLTLARGDIADALSMAERVAADGVRLALPDVHAEALTIQGNAAFLAGDGDAAIRLLEAALEGAGDDLVARISASIDLGRVETATRGDTKSLQAAIRMAHDAGAVSSAAQAEVLMAKAAVDRFALDEAEILLAPAIESARRYQLAPLNEALAAEAERRALLPGDDEAERATCDLASPACANLVLAVRLEDREGARRAIAALPSDHVVVATGNLLSALDGVPFFPLPTAQSLASCLSSVADALSIPADDEAARLLREADALLARFPWWRHVVRRLIGEAAIATGMIDVGWIRESLTFFEEAGHDRLASACRAILRRSGAPVPRKGRGDSTVPAHLRNQGVTSREMDVLRLVGRGLSNGDIAGRLFLSRRTIESHVASLMRKLGVQTRSGLASEANSRETTP